MLVLIDTNSLVSLVRYYLPFDKGNKLSDFLHKKVQEKKFIVIDKVYDECKYVAKKVVVEQLEWINDKKLHTNTSEFLPDRKFFNMLENQFCVSIQRRKLTAFEFENQKNNYLESADAKIILFAYHFVKQRKEEALFIVTEETKTENDNKLFRKIPTICESLNIGCKTLPKLLSELEEFNIEFKF